ncbi:MAG: helix-turn-helix transcriptional regulator [Mesorhizobium sp.]|uniref:helix-turn-helix domain-containing protein n=1 Tax=Mesorhizobium sp. TaxID=1871066 RepID=UPI000FE90090|nr:helix-turn-helix transcriptional regulator [Mesorhizobium sp.]RWE84226.1 MAG: XRE family transcriptional regulator [Mesorhizobium sp.]TIV19506.1 MAG: helix-turn-helix transcriptional regulator [Mesorhizobium sp.]TJW64606.1 MAG: helix-turn-helix transcriptional regulator [Mesorhizobium sp.]
MEVQSLVAWNLRRLRVERGISQDDLALSAGVERAYVGYLERAARNPTIITLEKIATALGVPMAQLFREPEPRESVPQTLRAGRKKGS